MCLENNNRTNGNNSHLIRPFGHEKKEIMRHLKKFNEDIEASGPLDASKWSWTKDLTIPHDMQLDIYDMSFELKDEGYDVSFQWWPPYESTNRLYKDNKYPHINILKREGGDLEKIYYGHIKEFCERIISYLDDKDYNAVVKYRKLNSNEYLTLDKSITNFGPFKDPMATSIHFKIEMISRKVYGNVFESNTEDVENKVHDLNDILLEVKDMGYYTNVDVKNVKNISNVDSYVITSTISRLRNVKGFFRNKEEFDCVREALQRLKEYADQNGLHIDNTWLERFDIILRNDKSRVFNIDWLNNTVDANQNTMYISLYPKRGRNPI